MRNNIRTALVVDDHPVMMEALRDILAEMDGFEVVATAPNGAACLEECKRHQPDLVFLDYNLPDELGSEVARKILRLHPKTHIVIFTGVDVMPFYNELLEIGVSGVMSKADSTATIADMIRSILDNRTLIPISVYHQLRMKGESDAGEPELTDDEIQIMKLVVRGATLDQIADAIHVSKRSVDNYLKKAYAKLQVKTRYEAIERFIRSRYHEA